MNAWQFLIALHGTCKFQTRDGNKVGVASNSELKRWLQNKAIICNGEALDWNEPMDFPIVSFVLFPNKPITLF